MTTTLDFMTHHLVGIAEIAELFGVSRQYADRLSRTESFPKPEVELASGRIWTRENVEAWARSFRDHFCMPIRPPHRVDETVGCGDCGRLWAWDPAGAWKNTVTPLVLEAETPTGVRRFFVQHLDMGAGPNGQNWTGYFDTLEEAMAASDNVYFSTEDANKIRQEIIETIDGETTEWRFRGAGSTKWSRPTRRKGGL